MLGVTERNSVVTVRFLCVMTWMVYDDLANKAVNIWQVNLGGRYYDIWRKIKGRKKK